MSLRSSPIALFASLLLAAVLSGCLGSDPAEAPAPDSDPDPSVEADQEAPTALPEASAPEDSESTTEETTEGDPSAEAEEESASAGDRELDKTVLTMVWPDESWDIEEISEDPCATSGPTISRMGLGEDYFTCGSDEMNLVACKQVEGDEALCVQNVMERKAARIHSPAAQTHTSPPAEGAIPMGVILADGTTCSYVMGDHMSHYEGRQSWVHCGENAALLLDLVDALSYFDPSEDVWTAELGVGMQPPETVDVAEIIYVATPEDAEDQGPIGP